MGAIEISQYKKRESNLPKLKSCLEQVQQKQIAQKDSIKQTSPKA